MCCELSNVCCYCKCSPEVASRVVAVANVAAGALGAACQAAGLAATAAGLAAPAAGLPASVILLLEAMGMAVFGYVLLRGVRARRPALVRISLAAGGLKIFVLDAVVLILTALHVFNVNQGSHTHTPFSSVSPVALGAGLAVAYLTFLGINIYFFSAVYSFYRELKEGGRRSNKVDPAPPYVVSNEL